MATVTLLASTCSSSTAWVDNLENAYTDTNSKSFAELVGNSSGTGKVYFKGFDFNLIPPKATVTNVTFKIKAVVAETNAFRYVGLAKISTGTSLSNEPALTTTATVHTLTLKSGYTWDDIVSLGDDFGFLVSLRGTSQGLFVYGIEIDVTFTNSVEMDLKAGDILDFEYTGAVQIANLPAGTYKLECWGAQGGQSTTTGSNFLPGYGGYSVGTLTLSQTTSMLIYVGGAGEYVTTESAAIIGGGFNGGGVGSSTTSYPGFGGGGASDIRIDQDSLYARVIVAGGGGGQTPRYEGNGGVGGGISGGDGVDTTYNRAGHGGTQTAGGAYGYTTGSGSFGLGGNSTSSYATGGGGGWYGGGSGYRAAGGGGSGYIYTSETASNYPSGCLLDSTYYLTDALTTAGNTSFVSPSGTSETGHSGDGYIRITVISLPPGGCNKITYNGTTLIDLTTNTVTANNMAFEKTAHSASGKLLVGNFTPEIGQYTNYASSSQTINISISKEPICFFLIINADFTKDSSTRKICAVVGTSSKTYAYTCKRTSTYSYGYIESSTISWSYSDGTLTITSSNAYFVNAKQYKIVYF